jgi:hypothetical protein
MCCGCWPALPLAEGQSGTSRQPPGWLHHLHGWKRTPGSWVLLASCNWFCSGTKWHLHMVCLGQRWANLYLAREIPF